MINLRVSLTQFQKILVVKTIARRIFGSFYGGDEIIGKYFESKFSLCFS